MASLSGDNSRSHYGYRILGKRLVLPLRLCPFVYLRLHHSTDVEAVVIATLGSLLLALETCLRRCDVDVGSATLGQHQHCLKVPVLVSFPSTSFPCKMRLKYMD